MADPAKYAPATQPAFEAQKGKGRPKGAVNKNTAALKDMILGALEKVGGEQYLARQANENPGPFMTLIGKVLPMQVTGEDGKGLTFTILTGVPRVKPPPQLTGPDSSAHGGG